MIQSHSKESYKFPLHLHYIYSSGSYTANIDRSTNLLVVDCCTVSSNKSVHWSNLWTWDW